jgi:hypothetical protein
VPIAQKTAAGRFFSAAARGAKMKLGEHGTARDHDVSCCALPRMLLKLAAALDYALSGGEAPDAPAGFLPAKQKELSDSGMRYWALNLVHLVMAGPLAPGAAPVFALSPEDSAAARNSARRVVEDTVLLCEHEGLTGKTECYTLAGERAAAARRAAARARARAPQCPHPPGGARRRALRSGAAPARACPRRLSRARAAPRRPRAAQACCPRSAGGRSRPWPRPRRAWRARGGATAVSRQWMWPS